MNEEKALNTRLSSNENKAMKTSYHFLGIGGIGMSALAQILIEKGEQVSGMDLRPFPLLQKQGVVSKKTLPKIGKVIYSTAIKNDHPDLIAARKHHLTLLHRSDLLQELIQEKKALLVTGTHGKTSTSALLTWILQSAGLNPTFAVGGILQNLKKNGGFGEGDYFVAEADESDGSFLNYQGEGAIITNIEKEHLDYWGTEANIVTGFVKFIAQIQDHNLLFWCADDPLLKKIHPPGISYGRQGTLCLKESKQVGMNGIFTATFKGKTYRDIQLPLMGEENTLNALAVLGMALQLGIPEKEIREAFLTYKGVKRRLEKIGEVKRISLYDDYAHHPTEIYSMLKALKKGVGDRRLIALFQPHRYTRTQVTDFSKAFIPADLIIITDIYSAGENPIQGVNGENLCKSFNTKNVLFLAKKKLLSCLPKMLVSGDVLVTIGAGDITEIAYQLKEKLCSA